MAVLKSPKNVKNKHKWLSTYVNSKKKNTNSTTKITKTYKPSPSFNKIHESSEVRDQVYHIYTV